MSTKQTNLSKENESSNKTLFDTGFSSSVIKPGLERIQYLLQLQSNPQQNMRFIHIAGTNGKGSLGSYCNAILAAAGYKVGWFSTPHLQRQTESIRITDGLKGIDSLYSDERYGEISEKEYQKISQKIKLSCEQMILNGLDTPSEFELMTAIALLHFNYKKCDWVIWETGMGGRLDATNILKNPYACMITAIGMDHSDWLGSNYVDIAREKAGIIKQNSNVYLYSPQYAIDNYEEAILVEEVFKNICSQKNAVLEIISNDNISVLKRSIEGQSFKLAKKNKTYHISQLAVYQPLLAKMAISVCSKILQQHGLAKKTENKIHKDPIQYGLSAARWPARLELCNKAALDVQKHIRPILLDGAHNPQGCQALAKSLQELLPSQEIIFLTGVLADKNKEKMFRPVFVSDSYSVDIIICTRPASDRAMMAGDLAKHVAELSGREALRLPSSPHNGYNDADLVYYDDDPVRAALFAVELSARMQKPLCVFGSLYLAGAVREFLIK